jgi:hypothetical protein
MDGPHGAPAAGSDQAAPRHALGGGVVDGVDGDAPSEASAVNEGALELP